MAFAAAEGAARRAGVESDEEDTNRYTRSRHGSGAGDDPDQGELATAEQLRYVASQVDERAAEHQQLHEEVAHLREELERMRDTLGREGSRREGSSHGGNKKKKRLE